jgi:hypothetical protein
MAAALSTTQLFAALTAEQIAALAANPPSTPGAPDAVAEEISAALAKVDAYTAGWLPSAALATSWARALAAWEICKRLGIQSEGQKEARDRTLKELEEVRDGKFQGIAADTGTPAAGARVSYGGKADIFA